MNNFKKSFSFGGGDTCDLTVLAAADWFVKNVLFKNLESENVRFPEHLIRLGTTPEGPKLSKQELEERRNQIKEPEERKPYNHYSTDLKGAECEGLVWDYIISTPSDVRCATFKSYDNKMFLQFTEASTTKTEAPDAQNPDAEKAKAPDAEKTEASDSEIAEAPDAEKDEAPDAEKTEAPDAEKTKAPDAEKAKAPDARKAIAPDAGKAEAPDVEKTEAPYAEKAKDSDAEKAKAPDAEKAKAPDAKKAKAPDAEKAKAPEAEKTEAPDAEKAKVSDAEKDEAPDAEKAQAADASTTANKTTQTEEEDLKKVPIIKAKKSANNQAHGANKSTKNEKSTQTKSARKAKKGPQIPDNQELDNNLEFDFVFLLGGYKTFVIFEVKAIFNCGNGKWEEQLERAELFYKTIIKWIGDKDYKEWTFLPVAAFPNAPNIKQVSYFEL